jgi:LysM repeat protein
MYCLYPGQCPAGTEGNYHVVQEGDTLYTISKFYNISLDDLIEANPDLEPELVSPGQLMSIPLTVQPADCPLGSTTYTVQKNDTFYSIAKRYKMRLSALLKANPNVNPDALLVGQSICLPMISASFANEAYRVRFRYPYLWSKFDNKRYEGIDGFFQISAIPNAASLEEIYRSEAYHKLKPYGTQPMISNIEFRGREACFIMPSHDQPKEMLGQSAFIALYDIPVEIEDKSYKYFIMWTDKDHMRDITDTLEFL